MIQVPTVTTQLVEAPTKSWQDSNIFFACVCWLACYSPEPFYGQTLIYREGTYPARNAMYKIKLNEKEMAHQLVGQMQHVVVLGIPVYGDRCGVSVPYRDCL